MASLASDVERYADPAAFAREVNLPLLGAASLAPVAPGAPLSALLAASLAGGLEPTVDGLAQTRQSLTLRSLLLAGFPNDPECFALGLALGRVWSRRGLKVAVVDVDAWHPTLVRPLGEPAEGLVDVLEYGCSFQRVAWELVAGSLWAVGPGSHPTDELRLADHPDWERAARTFSARADVTLFVAPLLGKPGVTGRLSKRVDGVLLTASVERVGRVALRDAFLELWGSDAPIIGCVAIVPGERSSARSAPSAPVVTALPTPAATAAAPARTAAPPAKTPAPAAAAPRSAARTSAPAPSPSPPVSPVAAHAPKARERAADRAGHADEKDSALVAALEREVRYGTVKDRRARPRRADWVWRGLALVVVGLAGTAAWMAFMAPAPKPVATKEVSPAGEEHVLPPAAGDAAPQAGTGTDGGSASVAAGLGTPASGKTPPAPSTPAGAPLTAAPPADGKPFRVHVASFRSEDKVAPIVRDLRLKGADAWYELASDGSGWYRVFVGRFATEDEAAAYAAWLLQNKWVERAHAYPSTAR